MEWLDLGFDEEDARLKSWETVWPCCNLVGNRTLEECPSCWDPGTPDVYERGKR